MHRGFLYEAVRRASKHCRPSSLTWNGGLFIVEKKNKEPLIKPPVIGPKQIYAEGDGYRPAGNDPVEQPQDVGTVLKQGTAQLAQGASTGSLPDIQEGTRITTAVANVLSGGDPM